MKKEYIAKEALNLHRLEETMSIVEVDEGDTFVVDFEEGSITFKRSHSIKTRRKGVIGHTKPDHPYGFSSNTLKDLVSLEGRGVFSVKILEDRQVDTDGERCEGCDGKGKYVGLRRIEDPCSHCGGSGHACTE